MTRASLRARGAAFRYRGATRDAFADVDLEVRAGECLLLLGPSGSGKSTLALALGRLLPGVRPGELRGSIEVDGRVGIVFQDPASQLVMERVEDEVAFGLENFAVARSEMDERIDAALQAVGLGGSRRARTRTLSGGEQQRLALADALAIDPTVLVLDEPTAYLDPDGAARFAEHLAALKRSGRHAVVLIEHRVELFWPIVDRVLVLTRIGRPLYYGTRDGLTGAEAARVSAAGVWLPDEQAVSADSNAPLEAPGAEVVAANDLVFEWPNHARVLHELNLAVREGERVAVVGSNGSGKSTLGRLLAGLLRPTAGSVSLQGHRPDQLPARDLARRAGYVFQDPEQQFLAARVEDEVMLGLREEERAQLPALMEALQLPLSEFADRSPWTLSGGEKRRLSLASCLVRRPALLVLDEPTFGQDRNGYRALLEMLGRRVEERAAVVAMTHDERFVRDFARRVLELRDGRVHEREGTADP